MNGQTGIQVRSYLICMADFGLFGLGKECSHKEGPA